MKTPQTDIDLQKQLVRQLRLLNFWITTFGVLLLLALGVIGFLLYQTVMFVKTTSDSIANIKQQTSQTLDIKSQACSGNDAFANLLRSSGACNE